MLSVSVQRSRLLAAGRAAPDDDDVRVCSVILASVVSLMLLCGVLSVLPSPGAIAATKAYVVLGVAAIMLVLMLLAWLVAPGIRALTAPRAPAPAPAAAAPVRLARRLCACGLADAAGVVAALPAFPYGGPPSVAAADDEEASASPRRRRSGVLCAVCLEDVLAGEMVRQLPACRHLFHVGCVDVWLRAHRTCPLCRCELPPRKAAAAAGATASAPVVAAGALPLPPV
ncbi:zinc finger, C3HC4 type family protein [Panicum miliaceum]|uniref:RING-type E3 ubiquitin transferase n=1 Tax=Panicum miliaceum TaxID=4540 RepID=A0A3L6S2G1_PANMI|nr:zinc finger, C3HC4 type family protein [Panicum miliaceum]